MLGCNSYEETMEEAKGHSRIFHSTRASCVWIMFYDCLPGRKNMFVACANFYDVKTPTMAGWQSEFGSSGVGRMYSQAFMNCLLQHTVPGPLWWILTVELGCIQGTYLNGFVGTNMKDYVPFGLTTQALIILSH